MNKKIAITAGDFNGIGSEIIIKALNKLNLPEEDVVLIGSKHLFSGLEKNYKIEEIPFLDSWFSVGNETAQAGEFSYNCLIKACEMAKKQEIFRCTIFRLYRLTQKKNRKSSRKSLYRLQR